MNTQTAPRPYAGDLLTDYREPGYLLRLVRMLAGFRQPRTSRAYKASLIELQRLSAPVCAVLVPFLAMLLLTLMPAPRVVDDRVYDITFLKPDETPILKDPVPNSPVEPLPADTFDPAFRRSDFAQPAAPVSDPCEPTRQAPVSTLDALANIRSVVVLTGIYGADRAAGTSGAMLSSNGGDQPTEDAVMRALRWLKKNQQPDGSWRSQKVAMTGLALLTFLAHGEISDTAKSPEFGTTVQRALEFLLQCQKPDGHFASADGNEYAHPIAAYALCEAYGMTLNPNVKAAAEKALVPIIRGQHPTGGWTYRMDPAVCKETGAYRDDTSYMGWCVQALRAARLTRLNVDGIDKACKLAVRGFKGNASPNGGFGYTGPGQGGLTGVGALCLQMLGASNEAEVRRALDLMDRWQPSFAQKSPLGSSPQYYFYYATQSKFHSQGKRWESWNREMKALYVKAQLTEQNAATDATGKAVDIGWWVNGDAHTDRPVMDTCLATLQLMVYYRSHSLATTSKKAVEPDLRAIASVADPDDVPVDTPKNL